MSVPFTAFCCAILLCGRDHSQSWGLRVLNRSTNELVWLHISWDAGDVWFPPVGSATSSYGNGYGAPSPDTAVFPCRNLLGLVNLPARIPGKEVLVSYLTSPGPTTNRVRVALPKADRDAVGRSGGNFVFVVTGDDKVTVFSEDKSNHPSKLPLCYQNNNYSLSFFLPASWRGYSVLRQEWQGISYLPAQDTTGVTARGPMIILRHPQWRADELYQDIPLMVFTRSQWESDKQGRFGIGAGGFDEELWHNEKYVFGMSSRYNAADHVKGWKEAADLVERNRAAHETPPLHPQ